MNRRDAVRTTAVLVGGLLLTSKGLVFGRTVPVAQSASGDSVTDVDTARIAGVLTPEDQALAESIADTLLPTTTASPGARAAAVGATMNLLLTDCYEADAQAKVVDGLAAFRRACQARFGAGFGARTVAQRETLLRETDAERQREGEKHWFGLVRDLAKHAYFTSEIGMTRARRWMLVPGRWVGCVPLEPGQPAWG